MSLTSSMDEADMEVAGIYKKFKTDSPLAVRMEEIAATPPPRAKPMPKTGTACIRTIFYLTSSRLTNESIMFIVN